MTVPEDDSDAAWDDASEGEDQADDSDDEPTIPCPACGCEIYEDTPRCPECGHYLGAEEQAGGRTPVWILVTALVCLAVALGWAFAIF